MLSGHTIKVPCGYPLWCLSVINQIYLDNAKYDDCVRWLFVRFCWGKKRKALICVKPCNAHIREEDDNVGYTVDAGCVPSKMGWIECTHSRGGMCIQDRHAQIHACIVSKCNICSNGGPFWHMTTYKNRTSRVPNVNKKSICSQKTRGIFDNSCIHEQKLFKQTTRIMHSADVHRTKIWRNGKLKKRNSCTRGMVTEFGQYLPHENFI